MNTSKTSAWVCLPIALLPSTNLALTMETVPVGNAHNVADTEVMRGDLTTGYGSVGYTYSIGKFEVTAGQYCEFLNAVAKTDTYFLYYYMMDAEAYPGADGCNIKRSGSPGSYSYSVAAEWANRPVNYVDWGSAARFCNWLHNDQPTGAQDASTTEDGSYALNGGTGSTALLAVTRKANATWVIPSEDEWYKAAYYDSNKPGGADYWDYPTRSDTAPSNSLDPAGTNNANCDNYDYLSQEHHYTIGPPYWRTEVGTFAGSPGPYGTFDQGGNAYEWTEARDDDYGRILRGGSYQTDDYILASASRYRLAPMYEGSGLGFRVAYVPEPATLLLLALGGLAMMRRRNGNADSSTAEHNPPSTRHTKGGQDGSLICGAQEAPK